eukprot:scaffold83967_cov58-Attheya_sp.AAC.3
MSTTTPTEKPSSALRAADDSDEDDEDYVPVAADSDDEDAGANTTTALDASENGTALSVAKQHAVDDAFSSLFGVGASSSSTSGADAKIKNNHDGEKTSTKTKKAGKKALRKKKKLLAQMFGKSGASKLLSTSKGVASAADESTRNRGPLPVMTRNVVTEVKKYAGQEIKVQRTVLEPVVGTSTSSKPSSSDETPHTNNNGANKKQGGGLDQLLNDISGPQKISTVMKTSTDWDQFKEKSGLDEDIEKKAQGKDAYLVKKDFLTRVDLRRFEQEKTDRDKKRAAAGI